MVVVGDDNWCWWLIEDDYFFPHERDCDSIHNCLGLCDCESAACDMRTKIQKKKQKALIWMSQWRELEECDSYKINDVCVLCEEI